MKLDAIHRLGKKRQSSQRDGYACLGDICDGLYECEYPSPWTKSGHNVDAAVMVVGQDWSSVDALSEPNEQVAQFGFDPTFPTNKNLDGLLARHFGLTRAQCYLTNLFVFIKHGDASSSIRMKDLVFSAQQFTMPEIEIIRPSLVICLGLTTFKALRRAAGFKGTLNMAQSIQSPFRLAASKVHCVAHTGALGMNNRGRDQVELDWQALSGTVRGLAGGTRVPVAGA